MNSAGEEDDSPSEIIINKKSDPAYANNEHDKAEEDLMNINEQNLVFLKQDKTTMNYAGNVVTGKRVLYGNPAGRFRGRCRYAYCSPPCQGANCPVHRGICFPIPPLVKAGLKLKSKDDCPSEIIMNKESDDASANNEHDTAEEDLENINQSQENPTEKNLVFLKQEKTTMNSSGDGVVEQCVVCGNVAGRFCGCCREVYCSHKCQREDWPFHRRICFPMPPLVKAELKLMSEGDFPNEISMMSKINKNKSKNITQSEENSTLQNLVCLKQDKATMKDTGDSVTGQCVVCGNPASRVCERCLDFYCSMHCQREDWPIHRHICFPMPPLIEAVSIRMFEDDFPNEKTLLININEEGDYALTHKGHNKAEDVLNGEMSEFNKNNPNDNNLPEENSASQLQEVKMEGDAVGACIEISKVFSMFLFAVLFLLTYNYFIIEKKWMYD